MAFPTGWGQYHKITVDASKVAGNLTNFPVPLTDGNFLATVYASTQAAGQDLRFSLDTAGASQLPFEIVSWSTASSLSEVWVRADSLATGSNKEFYVWYDNDSASALAADDTYGSQNVWDSNYVGVWHMHSDGTDSTSYGNDLTGVNTPVHGTAYGKIGGGLNLTHATKNYYKRAAADRNGLTSDGDKTWEAWVRTTDLTKKQSWFFLDTSATRGTYMEVNELDDKANNYAADTGWVKVASARSANTWEFIQSKHDDGSTTYIKRNAESTRSASLGSMPDINTDMNIGCFLPDWPADLFYSTGDYDEMRWSNTLRSEDYLVTNYNAQATTSLFSSPSDPTAIGGDTPVTPQPRGCLTCFTKLWGI